MWVVLFLLRDPLYNVTTSFADAIFTGLPLKGLINTLNTKGAVYCFIFSVNPITNASRLNLQTITTNYFYQFSVYDGDRKSVVIDTNAHDSAGVQSCQPGGGYDGGCDVQVG